MAGSTTTTSLPFMLFILCVIFCGVCARDAATPSTRWGAIRQWMHTSSSSSYDGTSGATLDNTTPTSEGKEDNVIGVVPRYVSGAGPLNRSIHVDYSKSMMHRAEVDLIISYLRPSDVYLEYGAGGSTLIFPKFVRRAYTIEHDCAFLDKTFRRHKNGDHNININNIKSDLRCIPVSRGTHWGTISNFEHGNYRQFKSYVDAVHNIGERKLDKVLIDGRARVGCSLRVLAYLKADSVVFLHDFYTRIPHYKVILRYYEEVARIKGFRNMIPRDGPIDMPQGLIVMRPKLFAVGLNLSEEAVHRIYRSIPWRFPFHTPLRTAFDQLHFRVIEPATNLSKWRRFRSVNAALHTAYKDVALFCLLYLAACLYFSRYTAFLKYKWLMTVYRRNNNNKSSKNKHLTNNVNNNNNNIAPHISPLPAPVEWDTAIAGASHPLSSVSPPVINLRHTENEAGQNRQVERRHPINNNLGSITATEPFHTQTSKP